MTPQEFAALADAAPRDPSGFPTYLLDYSRLPTTTTPTPAQLQAAKTNITTYEGYPSFGNPPQPIWSRLPNEPPTYYEAFRYYLTSPLRDPESVTLHFNQTTQPHANTPHTQHTSRRNAAAKSAAATLLPLHSFDEAYAYFYWAARARAYDILRPVAASRLRDHRRMIAEDAHYMMSNNILTHLAREIEERAQPDPTNPNAPVRPFKDMDPKDLIASIKETMEMQRTALRLPAKGPPPTLYDPSPNTGTTQAIRESAARYDGIDPDASEDERAKQKEVHDKKMREAIASNPELVTKLQEVAIQAYAHLQNKDINGNSTLNVEVNTNRLAPAPRSPKGAGEGTADVPHTDYTEPNVDASDKEDRNRKPDHNHSSPSQKEDPHRKSRKRGPLPSTAGKKAPTGTRSKSRKT